MQAQNIHRKLNKMVGTAASVVIFHKNSCKVANEENRAIISKQANKLGIIISWKI